MKALYDTIGINYTELRKPDSRIAALVHDSLGAAESIVNVGAGTGSYEPSERSVIAVEPSLEMTRKRTRPAHALVQARAEQLPFGNDSFEASMGVLTIHHWHDQKAGLLEMRRVCRGPITLLTFDPAHRPWLTDYLPQIAQLDEQQMPSINFYEQCLGPVHITAVPIPHDCTDGFLHAYWRRPHAYLDERIKTGMSTFWKLDDTQAGLSKLSDDIDSGEWERRYARLLDADEYDAGYRLVTTI